MEDFAPAEAIESLQGADDNTHWYVASDSFYEADQHDLGAKIYGVYYEYFQAKVAELNAYFGQESNIVKWDDPDYPDWAVGEAIVVWGEKGFWLRIHYEDRECPILVALSRIEE